VLSGDGHAAHPGEGTGVARGYDLSIAAGLREAMTCPVHSCLREAMTCP